MEPISHLAKVSIPNYLANLPIPDSFGGWFKLGVRDWLSLLPFGAALAGVTYATYLAFCPVAKEKVIKKSSKINPNIEKDKEKVVHSFDLEDIGEKAAFCRCWRSKKFPYCDGAHNAYNKETGDNVGPLCVQRKQK